MTLYALLLAGHVQSKIDQAERRREDEGHDQRRKITTRGKDTSTQHK